MTDLLITIILFITFVSMIYVSWINYRIYVVSKDILQVSVDLLVETIEIKRDTQQIKQMNDEMLDKL
jgi:hypothetical protein